MMGPGRAWTPGRPFRRTLPLVLAAAAFLIIALPAQAAEPPPSYQGPASFTLEEDSRAPLSWDPGAPWCVASNGTEAILAGEGPHVRIEGNASNGTLALATTTPNYFGETILNLTCADGNGTVAFVEVPIQVIPVNDSPVVQQVSIWSNAYDLTNLTVPNSMKEFEVFRNLNISVIAEDPDTTPADDDPSAGVDPNETLRCSLDWAFVGSLGIPQGNHTHPVLDHDSCAGTFEPGWDDLGTFTLTITVEDRAGRTGSFRFQIRIRTVGECFAGTAITWPVDNFHLPYETDLNATAIMGCAETETYEWFVTVGNSTPLEFSGRNPHIHLQNPERSDSSVVITCRATDNWYPQHPIVLERTVTGTIEGNPNVGNGTPLGGAGVVLIAGILVALAVSGLMRIRDRKRSL